MADLRPVSPGQPLRFSAGDINACFEAAKAHRLRMLKQEAEAASAPQSGVILVKNDTANDRDILEVLAIDAPLILPTESLAEFRSRVALSCILPGSTHSGRYVVLQEPIPAGKIGRAMVVGVTPAILDVTAESDRFAEVASGVATSLKTGTIGSARILWKESGTGTKKGVVMLTGETGGQQYIHTATADPTVNDDSGDGYVVGTIWVNTSTDAAFIAADVSSGAAVWVSVGGSTWNGPLIPDESSRTRLTSSVVKIIDTSGWYWFVLTAGGGGGGWGDSTSTPATGWYAGGGGGASGQRIFIGPVYLEAGQKVDYTHANGGSGGTSGAAATGGGNAQLELFESDGITPIMDAVNAYGGGAGGAAEITNTTDTKSVKVGTGGVVGPSASSKAVHFPYPVESRPGQPGLMQYIGGASPLSILNGGFGGYLEWPAVATNDCGNGGDGGAYNTNGSAGQAGGLDIISTASFTMSDP